MGFIDDLSPGQFDAKHLLELLAVLAGAWLIYDGQMELGLILIAAGVGVENLGELLASVPEDLDELPDE